jgi:hypothetical protein
MNDMGNYISFDKKAAEGYARALRKQRQREQQAAEEASIWKELIEEDLAKKRMASAVIKQPKKHRESIDITNELQHLRDDALKEIAEFADRIFAALNERRVLILNKKYGMEWMKVVTLITVYGAQRLLHNYGPISFKTKMGRIVRLVSPDADIRFDNIDERRQSVFAPFVHMSSEMRKDIKEFTKSLNAEERNVLAKELRAERHIMWEETKKAKKDLGIE